MYKNIWEIFYSFLILGVTSFGGPVAHIGYFRSAFVDKRKWLSEQAYAELVALCHIIPGPASSQVGMGIGYQRGGKIGAVIAWLGFTLPSAAFLVLVAIGVESSNVPASVIHGFKLVAAAVVTHALWSMAKTFCRTGFQITITLLSLASIVLFAFPFTPLGVIFFAGLLAYCYLVRIKRVGYDLDGEPSPSASPIGSQHGGRAWWWLLVGGISLLCLPWLAIWLENPALSLFDTFFRVGAIVFGGGHVVLPMLHSELVATGDVSADQFLMGYGLVQTVPGPLFTFAGFLGAQGEEGSVFLAAVALLGIFMPSFFLVFGVLPYWRSIRQHSVVSLVLQGVQAAVVGLLAAALVNPILSSTLVNGFDVVVVVVGFLALMRKVSPLMLVCVIPLLTWVLSTLPWG